MTATPVGRARSIIGASSPDDDVIQPSQHADRYAREAPDLARILRSSSVEVSAHAYEHKDADALAAQALFVRAARRARVAVFVTAVAAGLVLAAGGLAPLLDSAVSSSLLVVFALLGVAGGVVASYWIRRIREGGLLERWMTRRAEAETERLRYFDLVTKGTPSESPILQLEYFRRYQHDVQRAYYRRRASHHEAGADRALAGSSAGMAAAGAATGVAGIFGATLDPAVAALAAIGLIGQAWATGLENGEATHQHRRNSERYRRTVHALDGLHAMLDRVREAVAAGETEALHAYVDAVHDQLSLEHRQWLEETATASHAVARLVALLESYRGGG